MLVDINLLPEKERQRSTLLLTAIAILAAALLICTGLFIYTYILNQRNDDLQHQQTMLIEEQVAIRGHLPNAENADDRQQLEQTVEWAETYQYDTVPLLEDLIRLLPERGFFRKLSFTAPNTVTAEVQFDDKPAAAYYFSRMLSSELVERASLISVDAEMETAAEQTVSNAVQPRYIAIYEVIFIDERIIDPSLVPDNLPSEEIEGQEGDSDK